VRRLTDQQFLTQIALGTNNIQSEYAVQGFSSIDIRSIAIQRLTNQPSLAEVAREGKVPDIRSAAVKKVTDQALLANIATQDNDIQVRAVAVQGLTNQTVLAKLVNDSGNLPVQLAAIANLTDRTTLMRYAGNMGETVCQNIRKMKEREDELGGTRSDTSGACEAAARVRLILLDPTVITCLPNAKLVVDYLDTSQAYKGGCDVRGEDVNLGHVFPL